MGAIATDVEVKVEDGVLWLTKTNADTRQGISMAVLKALSDMVDRVRSDKSIRAVVIDAAGDGFHNGAVMVAEMNPDMTALGREDFRRIGQIGHTLGRGIANLDIPVIGVARGGALGGGLEFLLRSDLLYTLDDAYYAFPEVTLGLVAGWGGTQWGGRLVPFRKAQEMLLLGEPIDGRTAADWGLVTRSFADASTLSAHVERVLKRLRRCSPVALRWHKECLRAIWQKSLTEGEVVEDTAIEEAMANSNFVEPLVAFFSGQGEWDYVTGKPAVD